MAHLATVEQSARELEAQGCNMGDVISYTRHSAAVVGNRIHHYEEQNMQAAALGVEKQV